MKQALQVDIREFFESILKDAERYRYLRNNECSVRVWNLLRDTDQGPEFDKIIDHRMRGGPPPSPHRPEIGSER